MVDTRSQKSHDIVFILANHSLLSWYIMLCIPERNPALSESSYCTHRAQYSPKLNQDPLDLYKSIITDKIKPNTDRTTFCTSYSRGLFSIKIWMIHRVFSSLKESPYYSASIQIFHVTSSPKTITQNNAWQEPGYWNQNNIVCSRFS